MPFSFYNGALLRESGLLPHSSLLLNAGQCGDLPKGHPNGVMGEADMGSPLTGGCWAHLSLSEHGLQYLNIFPRDFVYKAIKRMDSST